MSLPSSGQGFFSAQIFEETQRVVDKILGKFLGLGLRNRASTFFGQTGRAGAFEQNPTVMN